jgi:hypothetical protein
MTPQEKAAVWDLEIYGEETAAAVLIETWKCTKRRKRSQF